MAEKMIKHLIFTYGKVVPNPLYHEDGDQAETMVVEGLARLGQVVDITRPYDLQRGEELDAFFTDAERKAIEDGTADADQYAAVLSARANADTGTPTATAVPGESADSGAGGDISGMSAEEIATHVEENKLNVGDTVALAGDDPELVERVLDSEDLHEGGPRSGVVSALEKKLADLTTGDGEEE